MTKQAVLLTDKFTVTQGRIFINGVQLMVRLPMIQQVLDKKAGLNTSGFISGYRGSPIGGYDAALWQNKNLLKEHNIVFQPGINEELASTAVWGTQQLDAVPYANVDGVFSIWYGKGPGVDRAGDALKHGNFSGSHKNGGVLVVYGDDHPGKSSTIAHHSEPALAANQIPSLYPADVQEYLEYGLLGWQMSRYTGLWVGFKTVNETLEQTATIDIDLDNFSVELPERTNMPEQGVNHRPCEFTPILDEMLVHRYKIPLVHQFVKANKIDRITLGLTLDKNNKQLGLVTAGKAYNDTIQALEFLGLTEVSAQALGLSIYKVGCIWPLEPSGIKAFAQDQRELFFIEEKKAFIEDQAAKILYNEVNRPTIVGKENEQGETLLASDVQITPKGIALAIAARLEHLGLITDEISVACAQLTTVIADTSTMTPLAIRRTPFFCSGCPHSTSTKQPEGSVAMAGIGCHGMAALARPNTLPPTQMGGEGLNWTSMAHFSDTKHVFQNLGDGTYYHSGLLSIRAAIASKVNITYKILYNDAVAMTGGQPVDGPISVGQISQQVMSEGAVRCVVVTDSPQAYNGASGLAQGVEIFHRDRLDYVQKMLRDTSGCSILIYEQTCAAEKRRRRKRGEFPDPAKRQFINDAVCEGCGDCSTQSNCVSILPKDTSLGRKRQIDQSSCNKDYSCVKGFCPSFVTVLGGEMRKPQAAAIDKNIFASLPEPSVLTLDAKNHCVMVAGIGGTGVITVSAILGMAAHIEGKACSIYDMTGLSQKNGAVFSHLRIAEQPSDISAPRVGMGDADLVIGFDLLAALAEESQQTFANGKTSLIGNSQIAPTAAFQFMPDLNVDSSLLVKNITDKLGAENTHMLDATGLAIALCGNTIAANMFVVGYAAQKGLLPVSYQAIEEAITLNNIAIDFNLNAFNLGRVWAYSPEKLQKIIDETTLAQQDVIPTSLADITAHRVAMLTQYQNAQYAKQYLTLVEQVKKVDDNFNQNNDLSIAVAKNLAKLMAYKDEYEVARLYSSPEFLTKLESQFSGDYKLKFNLAPPLFSKTNPDTGLPVKKEFGSWILSAFKLLTGFKGLRGTALDVFGYSAERKEERQLISDYKELLADLLANINTDNYVDAVKLANMPEKIRGFGHIKQQHLKQVTDEKLQLLKAFHHGGSIDVVQVVNPKVSNG